MIDEVRDNKKYVRDRYEYIACMENPRRKADFVRPITSIRNHRKYMPRVKKGPAQHTHMNTFQCRRIEREIATVLAAYSQCLPPMTDEVSHDLSSANVGLT
jgi:hypothetical protein